ncbi:helix-turn-helix domain-containing protein [Nonomuraea sp. NPDC048882]|uniref:helix-turn-helix domain-containing protein n=1 Tax=Nonomuraea sp. NPDC048882 TaxID=3154347 RepID=UPI0033D79B97
MSDTWTIGELAEHAARALRDSAPPPANGRVRDVPGERLIRWYTTIGLVDPPLTRRGRIARYGRRHLLQLVAVKRLQAAGRSIAEIQVALAGATDHMLESAAHLGPAPAPMPGALPDSNTHHAAAHRLDSTLRDNASPDNATPGSAPSDSASLDGTSSDGTAPGNAPPGYAPLDSAPQDGASSDSASPGGTPLGSASPDGVLQDGASSDSTSLGGASLGGASLEDGPVEGGPADGEGGRRATRGRFWAERPDTASGPDAPKAAGAAKAAGASDGKAAAARRRGRAGGGVVTGVRLGDGVRLVLDAGRVPSEEDVQAVLAAAGPLLAVLEERELI